MAKLSTLTAGGLAALMLAQTAVAQPRPYGDAWRAPPPRDAGYRHDSRQADRYYYNGRWVDAQEWSRHERERERWAQDYQRRRGHRDSDDSTALIAGILGFALGAAIVGSADQANKAQGADSSWDAYCARKYRSYDRRSRTYLGYDGLRHYCQ